MRTKDVDELIEPVSNYCNHTVQVAGPTRNIDRRLEVASAAAQPLHLSYGSLALLWSPDRGNASRNDSCQVLRDESASEKQP
jgi:hypothetical protein